MYFTQGSGIKDETTSVQVRGREEPYVFSNGDLDLLLDMYPSNAIESALYLRALTRDATKMQWLDFNDFLNVDKLKGATIYIFRNSMDYDDWFKVVSWEKDSDGFLVFNLYWDDQFYDAETMPKHYENPEHRKLLQAFALWK